MDVKNVGDNMVGFMSQIGWTDDNSSTPNKKISMEKIFVDVDTNGGNGNEIIGFEVLNLLHKDQDRGRFCVLTNMCIGDKRTVPLSL